MQNMHPSINQIKPPGNYWNSDASMGRIAENPKYMEDIQPYLQDFVKTGKWSSVNDLHNTGLIKHDSGKYISKAEMDALSRKHFGESSGNKPDASESPEQYFGRVSRYNQEQLSDADRAFVEDWKAGNFPPQEEMAKGGLVHMAPGGVVKWASQLAKTINSHKMESMSGEQWMKWLNANAPKSAKKEALASGTLDWLPQQGKVSKGAIIEHMKANAPQIKVKKFENNPKPGMQARFEELRNEGEVRRLTSSERDEIEELEQKLEDTPKTKFDEHVLPGGKNYREMTLSTSNPTGDDYIVPAAHTYRDNDADLNRILHMRMNDRPLAFFSGDALNIEELQSDWAQRGRSEGFKKPPTIISEEIANRHNTLTSKLRNNEATPEELSELADIRLQLHPKINKGLPAGPYVQNTEDWTRLGLNNAIKEAAEQGHNAVTWTGGDAQANRWSNEGLKHYYDTVMPSVSNDILKNMGVAERVGEFDVGTGVPHQGFNITPEMLDYIVSNGLPRFKSGGPVKMGVGGIVKELVKAAAPKLATKAPEIIKPSELSKLKAYLLQRQGAHGARRVERAADEVPNLQQMYTPRALQDAFNGGWHSDNASAVMIMNPAHFENYAQPILEYTDHDLNITNPTKYVNTLAAREKHIKELQSVKGFDEVPWLQLGRLYGGEQGQSIIPTIYGHEGRHRSRALARNGEETSLVRMTPRAALGELPRSWQEEYVGALNKEMQRADNKVVPQVYNVPANNSGSIESFEQGKLITRPAIQLPEMFAKGGAVHMKDGGTPFNDSPHKGMSHTTPARGMTEDELRNTMKPYEYEAPLDEPLISPDMAIGTGLPTAIAKLLGKGVMGAGKALAPVGNQFLEDYMARQGMTLSAAPTKRGVVSSLNDNANTASAAKYKPAGVMGQRDAELLTAQQRADAGNKAAEYIASSPQIKPSEAMGQAMEKGFKKFSVTQADRTRVGGGNIGGGAFSAISQVDPAYKGLVWGVGGQPTASRLASLTDPQTIWTTLLGSAEQHKTNPLVFDMLKKSFLASMKKGNLTPELEAKFNKNLALTFGEGAEVRDPNLWKNADTFDERAALADLMMGQGRTPKEGGIAMGGEKSGKGVIFKPTDILKRETEPNLLHPLHGGDVPTYAVGPRLFSLNGESVYRPDLHPGFPILQGGEDMGVNMIPSENELMLPNWHSEFKKASAERKTVEGKPWPRTAPPGYYDLTLGMEGKGLPSQELNDKYIKHLLRHEKSGGAVHMSEGGDTKTGGKFSHEALLAKTKADEPIHEQVQRYLDMMKVDAAGGRDVYGTNLYGRAKMDIPVGKATVSPYLEGSAYRPAGQTFSGQLTGAGVNVTLPFKQGGDVGVSRDTMMIELMNKGKR